MFVLRSSDFLYNREGVTHSYPLSIFMCAVETLPLICFLHNQAQWTQVWYPDDASVCGHLNDIHQWFSQLCFKGPVFGYHPAPAKSYLLASDRHWFEVERLFSVLDVWIVADHCF